MVLSIQKSFSQSAKTLFLVATPIGNLQEFTPRALEILNSADLVVCENTFSCRKLMNAFKIARKELLLFDNIKEKSIISTSKTISKMLNYEKIVLLSKAGYPLISDPGRTLVRSWIDTGHHVVPVSGSSAFINALVASGFYYHNFTFLGFLPRKKTKQAKILKVYTHNFLSSLVIYEATNRVLGTLSAIRESVGNRMIALCRELTKVHEEFLRGTVEEVIDYLGSCQSQMKGELVIVVSIELASDTKPSSPLLRKRWSQNIKQI